MRTRWRAAELRAVCGPAFLLATAAGLLIAHLVPPPSASDSAPAIAAFYREHSTAIEVGMLVVMVGLALAIPFQVELSRLLIRGNPRLAPSAAVQAIAGTVVLVGILLPVVFIAVAAFRPERPPALTQLLNDVAFVTLLWPFSPATLEAAAVGLAVLSDRSESPLFPRWVGWFDLAVAAVFALGGPSLFVMHGAFGWDGALAFWAVFAAFGLWVLVTCASMLRAIRRPAAEEDRQADLLPA